LKRKRKRKRKDFMKAHEREAMVTFFVSLFVEWLCRKVERDGERKNGILYFR